METSKPDIDVSGLAPVLLDIQVSNGTIKQEPRAAPEAMTSAKEPSRYLSGVRLYLVFRSFTDTSCCLRCCFSDTRTPVLCL